MKTHDITPSACPACGALMEHATAVDHKDKPRPGSLLICAECGEAVRFVEGMRLESIEWAELEFALEGQREDLELLRKVRFWIQLRNGLRRACRKVAN